MDRREFLAATAVAAVSPLPKLDTLAQPTPRQYIELRRYHLLPGTKQRAFSTFVGEVAIPAMNRAGIGRVGAFTVVYGENAPSMLMLLTHQTLDSVVSLRERLANDAEYMRAGAAIIDAPLSDPAFVRVESALLRAFDAMPTLEPSAGAGTATPRGLGTGWTTSRGADAGGAAVPPMNACQELAPVPSWRSPAPFEAGVTPFAESAAAV